MLDSIMTSITDIFGLLPQWAQALSILIGGIVTTATAVTVATPTKVDDEKLPLLTKPLNVILGLLNSLAGNVIKNRNADDPKNAE